MKACYELALDLALEIVNEVLVTKWDRCTLPLLLVSASEDSKWKMEVQDWNERLPLLVVRRKQK